jgi:hypothetical protein
MDLLGCALTLRTNHRAESQRIIDNACRIASKLYPLADSEGHFEIIELPEEDVDESLSNGWLSDVSLSIQLPSRLAW